MKRSNVMNTIIKYLFLSICFSSTSFTSAQVPTTINVEIDWMQIPGGHSHQPQPNEIAAAIQMFTNVRLSWHCS
jgi:hypothetical protein